MLTDRAPLNAHCALVLDDDSFVAEDYAASLEALGFSDVLTAGDLETAEQVFARHRPMLAMLDYSLRHGQNSLELGLRLAEQGVKVIFMSGYGLSDLPGVVSQFPFIEKPASGETLRAALQMNPSKDTGA